MTTRVLISDAYGSVNYSNVGQWSSIHEPKESKREKRADRLIQREQRKQYLLEKQFRTFDEHSELISINRVEKFERALGEQEINHDQLYSEYIYNKFNYSETLIFLEVCK